MHTYGLSSELVFSLYQVKDVVVEVVDGDARNVLCEAVEKHHASILVVGSHGYGAIKRYVFIQIPIFMQLHCDNSVKGV